MKPVPWYQRPMRIAALQCNFGEDTLSVIDRWADMGFNVEQLFHPMADLYSAIYRPEKHAEIIRAYVKKAHQKGIRIILYLNVHILGPSQFGKSGEWSQRDSRGGIVRLYDNVYPSICLNSPWRAYFFSVLDSLAGTGIDGIFLDGPIVQGKGCFCRHCRAAFRQKYGADRTKASGEKIWAFNAWTKDNFLNAAYRRFKKRDPRRVFYINLPVLHVREAVLNVGKALAYNDILGTEGGFMHYGPAKNAFLWKPSLAAKLIEAVAPHKPRVIFMAADHKPWSFWPHSPLETTLCIASCTAHGAGVWYGLHGTTALLETPAGRAAGRVFRFFRKHESWLYNSRSMAKTALFYSFATARHMAGSSAESDFTRRAEKMGREGDPEKAVQGLFGLLSESQVPFDIVTDFGISAKKLSRYRVIVLPAQAALDRATVKALRSYVRSGGTLIAEMDASLCNGIGKRQGDFQLADVFGVRMDRGYQSHGNWNYFEMTVCRALEVPLIPKPSTTVSIRARRNVEILAQSLPDLPGRYAALSEPDRPFLVRNRYGRGQCFYFAGGMGEMYGEYRVPEYRKLVAGIVRACGGTQLSLENAPTHLEVSMRASGKAVILHLVNYHAGPGRPFESTVPVRNLRIFLPKSMPVKNARSLQTGRGLPLDRKTNAFTLPVLKEHDMIVLFQ